jgi:hypothetical protein
LVARTHLIGTHLIGTHLAAGATHATHSASATHSTLAALAAHPASTTHAAAHSSLAAHTSFGAATSRRHFPRLGLLVWRQRRNRVPQVRVRLIPFLRHVRLHALRKLTTCQAITRLHEAGASRVHRRLPSALPAIGFPCDASELHDLRVREVELCALRQQHLGRTRAHRCAW